LEDKWRNLYIALEIGKPSEFRVVYYEDESAGLFKKRDPECIIFSEK
jgi:hypothetical protein